MAPKTLPKPDMSPRPKVIETLGLPGIELNMTLTRLNSKNPNDPRNAVDPAGSPGKYRVSFVLSRPGQALLKENHISFADNLTGDSHIGMGSSQDIRMEFRADRPDGAYTFFGQANEKGFLGKIEILEFDALSFQDAALKAYNALSPTLSRLSLLHDVPVNIFRMTTIELSTQNMMSSLTLPFIEQTVSSFKDYQPDKDLAKFASLYREALNSGSPNYQYLCYFKIIEGIRRIRMDRTTRENQEALARGEKPPVREREILPSDPVEQSNWLSAVFGNHHWSIIALAETFPSEAVGRKITDLIDGGRVLDMVRNKIAHAILRNEDEETYTIDDGLHTTEIVKWLPLCKCIARYLLKKEYPMFF